MAGEMSELEKLKLAELKKRIIALDGRIHGLRLGEQIELTGEKLGLALELTDEYRILVDEYERIALCPLAMH